MNPPAESSSLPWSRGDTLRAVAWFVAGLAARAPVVARVDGVIDHDQAVVGLMALDVSQGRRFPIFFDGQRYMGAVEAYVAAGFVRLFGHEPSVVALAPWVAFGLFAAGQYALWRVWAGQRVGNRAALLTTVGSPMLALWGVIPRGGYVEFLAWALPTLGVYRAVTRAGRKPLTPWGQAAWGFLLAFGYFLNPLSLILYTAMAVDWLLGRHGADLRREHNLRARWLDGRWAVVAWVLTVGLLVTGLAALCHVDPIRPMDGLPYTFFLGRLHGRGAIALAGLGVAATLGAVAWWLRARERVMGGLTRNPWMIAGLVAAFAPFVVSLVMVRLGIQPLAPSLPVWIGAPWKAGPNLENGLRALGPLVGSDPRAAETVLVGPGAPTVEHRWSRLHSAVLTVSPAVVAVAACLVMLAAWRERAYWRTFLALRRDDVATPGALASFVMIAALGLYSLQGSSSNASSVRYVVPIWVVLPGLLALGLSALPRRVSAVAAVGLLVPWSLAQWCVWEDIRTPPTLRALTAELQDHGVEAFVSTTPVATVVTDLSHGAIAGLEYQPLWPRLGARYLGRFRPGDPVMCVVDTRIAWECAGEVGWAGEMDFGRHLRGLSAREPGRVTRIWTYGSYEVWRADLPLWDVLALEPDDDGPDHRDVVARVLRPGL